MSHYSGPLLTRTLLQLIHQARDAGRSDVQASFDLGRSVTTARLGDGHWSWQGRDYPCPERLKDRSIYYFDGEEFSPVSRFDGSLIKLVPTEWGAPTFEIDGIKMLPSARESPFEDARRKVALIAPAGKTVLDTCGGLGYFAACALEAGAGRIISFEKNPDVLWLRQINSWSPDPETSNGRLDLRQGDSSRAITQLPDASVDALLHDPPRFGIAGELYSLEFYRQLARVIRRGGRLFHYTGSPNKLTSGRDVPGEVATRLEQAGFKTERVLDGVQGVRR